MSRGARSGGSACLVLALIAGLGAFFVAVAGVIGLVAFFRWQSAAARPIGGPSIEAPSDEPVGDPPAETASTDESPDFKLETSFTPYTVSGRTTADLRSDMNAKGPTDTSGHHDAFTRWHVRWSYPHDKSDLSCSTGAVHVDVQITYTLPEWTPPGDAAPDVVERWQRYRRALRKHEDGHRDHGVDAGHEVLRKVRDVSAQSSCEELDRRVNETANRVLDDFRDKDVAYDKETRHGATQGAVFP